MSIRSIILARLLSDQTTLYPDLVPGGIYDREIKDSATEGGTPAAFWINPADPAKIRRMRPSIHIGDGGEVDAPGFGGPPNEKSSYPRVYIYVPATADGKAKLEQIDARVMWLITTKTPWNQSSGWRMVTDYGTPATITALERSPALDSEAFPGNLLCFRRFQVDYLRP